MNFVFSTTTPADSNDPFGQPSAGNVIGNIVLFIAGAVSVLTWLPGIIVGIILLATRKK